MSENQRWARWLFLALGIVTLIIWVVPLLSFWNTYHCLDLRHSGVGVAPDKASAWATGVVTVGWFMFSVWAVPQIKNLFWSYVFFVIGISHLGLAMGIFLFIRLSKPAASFFLKSPEDVTASEASAAAAAASTDDSLPSESLNSSSSMDTEPVVETVATPPQRSSSKPSAKKGASKTPEAGLEASQATAGATASTKRGKRSASPPSSVEEATSGSQRATRASTRRTRDADQ